MLELLPPESHPKLHEIKPVMRDYPKDQLLNLIKEMVEFGTEKKAVGLAAPQIGECLSLFIVKSGMRWEAYCNVTYKPAIHSSLVYNKESCLSLEETYNVKRWNSIVCNGYVVTTSGQLKLWTETIDGSYAFVFQHEVDHCRGILISQKGERI